MSIVTWQRGTPHFKQDEPTRHATAKERRAEAERIWRELCRLVDARDGKACRCCDKRSDPEATGLLVRGHRHHIVYRSAGGQDTTANVVTICADCHAAEHANRLRIDGVQGEADADKALIFWRKDEQGVWFIGREEVAVRVVRKD